MNSDSWSRRNSNLSLQSNPSFGKKCFCILCDPHMAEKTSNEFQMEEPPKIYNSIQFFSMHKSVVFKVESDFYLFILSC